MTTNKKIFIYLATVVAITVGALSCTTDNSKGADPALDSLAMARGWMNGQQIGQQIEFSNMMGQNIDLEMLMKGVEEGMKNAADSTKMWYYQGVIMGYQMGHANFTDKVSNKIYMEYFKAAMEKDTTKLTWDSEAMMAYLNEAEEKLQEKKQAEQAEAKKEQYNANIEEGEKYLAEYTKGEGVIVLPSGVAYKVLQPGDGITKPTTEDTVEVKYVGRLINGEEFDKSGETPISFGVTSVIPGWTQVLQEMSVGEKVEVVIPYDQAYGENGSGGSIEPYKTLIFEVELVKVIKAEAK